MAKREKKLVGEICLYGNRETGAGWLAQSADGKLFGDGEPRPLWGATDAMWRGLRALREWDIRTGIVRVFAPGGERMAEVEIGGAWPYYGDLKWQPAIVYTLTVEDIRAAAEKQ